MNITWDSTAYTTTFDFVYGYGEEVADLVDVPSGSFVVDLGCGNGALTEKLQQRGYKVLGIDSSPDMLDQARILYPDITFQLVDALTFQLEQPADAVFSNAVFHWIDREQQLPLARNIAHNLRPGGELVTEFGGAGCAETVHRALEETFAAHGLHYQRTNYFPTVDEYTSLLKAIGFRIEYAALFDRPTPQKGTDGVADWIRMFVQAPFEGIGASLAEAIIREASDKTRPVLYHDDTWYVDYVRIRVKATLMPD